MTTGYALTTLQLPGTTAWPRSKEALETHQ
jgi:hypothetical protein